MRTFHVHFIDDGNCDIWDCQVQCNGFSEAIGQAIFEAGLENGLGKIRVDVLTDLCEVRVRELK